ncbi:MAG: SGNH/GDSL hydrolase family protein [Verrucomicrobiae bacterium]|nr:SGNH/GDSL hydrolase family protein [Verrucomicrobiae bacterium]
MKNSLAVALALLITLPTLSFAQAAKKKEKEKAPSPLMQIEDVEGLPRVLLIGDSISIGYTLPVRELLRGKANVHRPNTNCGPTTNGLAHLDEWLDTGGAGKKWDVIHFNWGLHDLKYVKGDTGKLVPVDSEGARQQVPPAEYEKNLRELVDRLQKTGAKLIWRNTTPVPEGADGRVPGDAAKYNAIAAKIMKEKGVPTDDLYTFAKERLAEIQRPANVHFSPEGSQKLAEEIVGVIEKTLAGN